MKKRFFTMVLALLMLLPATVASVAADPTPAPEILGASIRTEGVQGLRFVGRISKSCGITLTAGGEDVNFGILLIPESVVAADTEITKDTTNVKVVPAKILMSEDSVEAVGVDYDDGYYYFSAVQTGIPAEYYGTNLLARAYVKDGGTYYYSAQVKRSVKYVADAVVEAGGDIPAAITKALADYDAVGSDILVNGSGFFGWDLEVQSSELQNTYHRLASAHQLNVAYLGGSVTVGVGLEGSYYAARDSWRALTTTWFRTNFPTATITETNAGIGGTGSVFGTYRAIDDLKLNDNKNRPDLLFIDFAINDAYDAHSTESAYASDVRTYMETIVRTVYEYAPYCDIIFVYVTDKSHLAYTDSSHYPTLAAQHDVAVKYGIKEIYVGKMLVEEAGLNGSNWNNTYFGGAGAENPSDIVHPNSKGYAKYAGYIQDYLNTELSKTLNPYVYTRHSVPTASYSPISYPARYFFNDAAGKTTGFTLYEYPEKLADKGYLKATTVGEIGAKVKFTFTGTGLQLWTYARAEGSTIRVTIDGVSTNYTIQRGSAGNKAYRVASGLANTAHTVTIELTATSGNDGNLLTLQALMVEGDPNFTGVTFQSVD